MLFGLVWMGMVQPSTARLSNDINGASIYFEVSRQVVLHPWQCVPVRWDVEGIEKVFYDEKAAIGAQTSTFCPADANRPDPTLYIDFRDNFIQEFTIPVTVLLQHNWIWATLLVLGVVGGFLHLPQTIPVTKPGAGLTRRQLLLGGGALVLVALSGVMYKTLREPELTIHDGWVLPKDEVKPNDPV